VLRKTCACSCKAAVAELLRSVRRFRSAKRCQSKLSLTPAPWSLKAPLRTLLPCRFVGLFVACRLVRLSCLKVALS
jgi:hypothetical protein